MVTQSICLLAGTFKNTNSSMREKRSLKAINEKYIKQISDDDLNR